TPIEQREHLVAIVAEHRDVHSARPADATGTQHGDVGDAADHGPLIHLHAGCSTGRRVNWRMSTAALSNSNHGSGSPSRLNCNRSQSALRPASSSRIF